MGDALLIVASLDNRGTLGAAQKLRIEAPTLLNQGLVFSGADMALRANSLTNLKGDLYSLGALSAARMMRMGRWRCWRTAPAASNPAAT